MAAFEVIALDTATPQLRAPGASDTYRLPRSTALDAGLSFGWSTDLTLFRDAANTLALRNGTNAQAFRVYNTYTDASNYERGKFAWETNVLRIGTEKAGTGTARALELQTDGTTRLTISTGGVVDAGGGNITLASDVRLSRRASGVLLLDNNGGSDFSRLQFGGTTSSYPSLKRNGTVLETKLADDSGFAPHGAEWLSITDGVTAPAAAAGRARIYVDTADGDLKVVFADGTVKTIVTDT